MRPRRNFKLPEGGKKAHQKRERNRATTYRKNLINQLTELYGYQCAVCGWTTDLTLDHIKPVSKGGMTELHNLQLLCRECNGLKADKWNTDNQKLTRDSAHATVSLSAIYVGGNMLSEELLNDLRNRVTDDPALEALLITFDAMRHDLETSEGLWCIDHQPVNEPEAFRLTHKSLRPEDKDVFKDATFHEYNPEAQASSGWRGWYDRNDVCVGFLGMDGKRVAFDAATDTLTVISNNGLSDPDGQ